MTRAEMQDSLFTIELPLVNTNEKLNKIKNVYSDCDPYFITSGCIKKRREKFNNLWIKFKPLADKHFLSQVKKEFHERTWEMYIGCVLKKYFSDVTSEDNGPDFILNRGKTNEIFIEAVACKRGDSINAVPEVIITKRSKDIIAQNIPHDKILLRLLNSITYKANKYKDFIKTKTKPYIIAVNKGVLEYPDTQIPLILKCLFGVGYKYFEKFGDKLIYNGWTRQKFIEKKSGDKISMMFFEKEENGFVSAIIYSPENVLNYPENIGSDCVLIHNPKAKFPVDMRLFSFLQQWKTEYSGQGFKIKKIEP